MKRLAKTLFILSLFLILIGLLGGFGWFCIVVLLLAAMAKRFSIPSSMHQNSAVDDESSIEFDHEPLFMDDDVFSSQSSLESNSAFDNDDSFDDWYYYHRHDPFDDINSPFDDTSGSFNDINSAFDDD